MIKFIRTKTDGKWKTTKSIVSGNTPRVRQNPNLNRKQRRQIMNNSNLFDRVKTAIIDLRKLRVKVPFPKVRCRKYLSGIMSQLIRLTPKEASI